MKFNLFFYNQNFLHWRKTEFVFFICCQWVFLENQSKYQNKTWNKPEKKKKVAAGLCFSPCWDSDQPITQPIISPSTQRTKYLKPEATQCSQRGRPAEASSFVWDTLWAFCPEILLWKDLCELCSCRRPPPRSSQTELVIVVLLHLWLILVSVCSSGDVKVGASSQGLAARYKKSPWTAATLAQEAQELTRTVRAILDVDCKWSQLHARRSACPPPPALPVCVCRPAWSRNKQSRRPAAVSDCPPCFSAELLDDPTVGEQSRRDVGRTSASSRDPHRSLPNTSSAPAEGLAMSELCMKASAHRTAALFQRFNLRSLQDGSGVSPGNTTGESLVQVNSLDEGVCEAERLHECFQVWPSMRETAPKPAAPHSQSIVVNCLKRKFSYCSYS